MIDPGDEAPFLVWEGRGEFNVRAQQTFGDKDKPILIKA
jgi:hypothetical protein